MEIPNYDSVDDPDKKYKQLFPYMPSDTFRMLICGNSGSGKTNLLYHMLRWLPRVFTNNPSYLAYDTEGHLVTLSLRFGSRNSPLSLPM